MESAKWALLGTGDCPSAGGTMNRMPEGFCIDNMEVTRTEYFAWLATEPALDTQSAACAANADYFPTCLTEGGWGLDRFLDNPISCVDWCDAQAFCQTHDKRLCGALGGGELDIDSYADPAESEWFAACSAAGDNSYVYGPTYEAETCHETLREGWGSAEVGSHANCVSPSSEYTGIYDLAGNLAEWENACEGERCRVRGGSFQHEGNGTRCDAGSTLIVPNDVTSDAVGFRCCAD